MCNFVEIFIYNTDVGNIQLYNEVTMVRPKKAAKLNDVEPEIVDRPSDACRKFIIQKIVNFYEAETIMSLESKYVRYQEECVDKFKADMKQLFLNVLNVPRWQEQMQKRGFLEWLDLRVHDALWNFPRILDKYGREQRPDDEHFPELVLKVDLFIKKCRPFAQRKNRKASIAWWRSEEGVAHNQRNQQHFISLPDTVRVICSEDKVMRGGYAEIRRVRIEGCPQIPSFWEFAAKRSLNHRTNPELARLEHFNEVMAMRIPHPGVIRFVAVHGTANEGYSYWWNGGTMREMFHLDNKFLKNIADGLANPNAYI